MSEYTKKAREDIRKAYEESGLGVLQEVLAVFEKYQDVNETGMLPEYGIEEMQNDALHLTALTFTVHTFYIRYEAEASRAKARIKYERAKQFNAIKVSDTGKSDKRAENEAEEGVYQYVLEEIEKQKIAGYIDVSWQRAVDLVNMLKKCVERMMWQGVQPT